MESVEQYNVHEFLLKAKRREPDPWAVCLGITATHEGGMHLDIPGFYDGDDTWRIRFSPSLTGKWTITVVSDTDIDSALPDISCVPGKDPDSHGRLCVSDQYPHRFAFSDGTPALPLGFEWNWLSAYHQEHQGPREDRQNPTFGEALDRIQSGGFNYIVANLYADYYHKTPDTEETRPYLYQHPRLYLFGGTNEQPDHSILNPSFFQDLDQAVKELERRHIILHLMIQVQNKKVNWPEPGSAEDDQFWQYVVARYQAYTNIVWDLSKESYNLLKRTGSHAYALSRVKLIRETDAHDNLVTAHDTERESWGRSTELDDACDFITDQVKFSGTVDGWEHGSAVKLNREAIRRWRNVEKPYLNVEYGYEAGEPPHVAPIPKMTVSGDTMLLWTWALLAGGAYANYYYCNTSWDLCRFDLIPESWKRFGFLKTFVDEIDLQTLTPDNDYTSSGMCGTCDGQAFFVFLTDGGNTRVDLSQSGGENLVATWLDTHTGERADVQVEERGFWSELANPLASPDNPCAIHIR